MTCSAIFAQETLQGSATLRDQFAAKVVGARMMDKRALGKLTWYCDVFALVLTIVYCAIVISDIVRGEAHLTSTEWFKQGFCVWRGENGTNSHTLCPKYDLPLGLMTFVINSVNSWKQGKDKDSNFRTAVRFAILTSMFNMLHGLAHHDIGMKDGDLSAQHPSQLTWLKFAQAYLFAIIFLGIAPFMGYLFGAPLVPLFIAHLFTSLGFMYVPPQLAFGAVQLVIVCYYCIPRILWIGWETDEDLSLRVFNGWAVSSIGNLLLLAVVFSEAFACETFYKMAGGHVIYDLSTQLLTVMVTLALWKQGSLVAEKKVA